MDQVNSLLADELWQRILTHLITGLSKLTVMTYFGMESRGLSLTGNVLTVELPEGKNAKLLYQQFDYFIKDALP